MPYSAQRAMVSEANKLGLSVGEYVFVLLSSPDNNLEQLNKFLGINYV